MIAAPLEDGEANKTDAVVPDVTVTVGADGADGTATGVRDADEVEAEDEPIEFVAVTLNV